jgi:hypothetical protein
MANEGDGNLERPKPDRNRCYCTGAGDRASKRNSSGSLSPGRPPTLADTDSRATLRRATVLPTIVVVASYVGIPHILKALSYLTKFLGINGLSSKLLFIKISHPARQV